MKTGKAKDEESETASAMMAGIWRLRISAIKLLYCRNSQIALDFDEHLGYNKNEKNGNKIVLLPIFSKKRGE